MKTATSLFMAVLVILAGCGKSEEPEVDAPEEVPMASASADGYRIEIAANDRMQFDLKRFRAPAGEKLTVVLNNVGSMNAREMGHNWVLLAPGTPVAIFVSDAGGVPEKDYLPTEGWGESILAATGMTGGGEQVEVTFTVPEEPGEYVYICTFPGHYYAGMKGILVVEQQE